MLLIGLLPSCGYITVGGGSGINDPVPSGVIIAQGTLQAQPGYTLSGVVSVYKSGCDGSTCTFTVRLQNLSAPAQSNLQLIATINETQSSNKTVALRSSTGNQNYVFTGLMATSSWIQIAIHPGSSPENLNNYAIATLQAVADSS